METLNTDIPMDEQPSVETTPEQNPVETVEQPAEAADQQQQAQPNIHQQNNINAQRRIRKRERMRARMTELQDQRKQFEGKEDDYSKFQVQQIDNRIGDMEAMSDEADDAAAEFEDRARRWFGEDTPLFMQQTARYAEYVNKNEPDLLRFAEGEYGPILLHEWYKRMDDPKLRDQWLAMAPVDKHHVLQNFYSQIRSACEQHRQMHKQNVPIAGGGRQTPDKSSPDEFGAELDMAIKRHKEVR